MLLRIRNLCDLRALPLSSLHQAPHFHQFLICQRMSADEQKIPGKKNQHTNKRKMRRESGLWCTSRGIFSISTSFRAQQQPAGAGTQGCTQTQGDRGVPARSTAPGTANRRCPRCSCHLCPHRTLAAGGCSVTPHKEQESGLHSRS